MKKIKVAIAGATGFVGLELLKILTKHPNVDILYLYSQSKLKKSINFYSKDFKFKKKLPIVSIMKNQELKNIDVIFTALPHGEAHLISKKIRSNSVLIDLSADFRIDNKTIFEKWYKLPHQATNEQKKSIYGLSEINRSLIKKSNFIACPGCYPTSILLPLLPLVKNKLINTNSIKADSKSGYSGAGKKTTDKKLYPNINENISIYGVGQHRHMPEIDQELSKSSKKKIKISFTPHLIPTFRGILSTIYLDLPKGIKIKKVKDCLLNFYKKEKFVNVVNSKEMINTNRVLNTNNCNIAVYQTRFDSQIIIASSLDNLIKGAAGQAVQNFNIRFGFKETLSLV